MTKSGHAYFIGINWHFKQAQIRLYTSENSEKRLIRRVLMLSVLLCIANNQIVYFLIFVAKKYTKFALQEWENLSSAITPIAL